ncbi:MAG: polysaccharide pyruvyl transferase family protein [Planctomycetota bacterium]
MLRDYVPLNLQTMIRNFRTRDKYLEDNPWDQPILARDQPKIFYTITPHPALRNIGDHAQVVAIYEWLAEKFPEHRVVEFDKFQSLYCIPEMKKMQGPADFVLLHSGGNLGDRGQFTERSRRIVIASMPRIPIISLPQTIYFSDTDEGRKQRRLTRKIYNKHRDLTVIGRDPISADLAAELFPNLRTFALPDFVLSYRAELKEPRNSDAEKRVLLCFRQDPESVMDGERHKEIEQSLPYPCEIFDTETETDIAKSDRKRLLDDTLSFFNSFDAVITDRYHGLIFSTLCGKPTVVLPTIDHKLTSAFDWFEGLDHIAQVPQGASIAETLDKVMAVSKINQIEWGAKYFDGLAKMIAAKLPA